MFCLSDGKNAVKHKNYVIYKMTFYTYKIKRCTIILKKMR